MTQPIRNRNARFFLFAIIGIRGLAQCDGLIGIVIIHVALILIAILAQLIVLAIIVMRGFNIALYNVMCVHTHIHIKIHRALPLLLVISSKINQITLTCL